jgi:anaerobic selenocysteine-containing dehydrogenase
MLGANPYESNGSLATAPDWPGRLQAIRERGGKVVVVDPRRTKTAAAADEHVFIRPGADALFLFALANVLFAENLVDLGHLTDHVSGLDDLAAAVDVFTPEVVATTTGIEPERIRQIARDLAHAESAAVYGRIGTHTAEFGTMASWMVDALNVLTGNLDREGGAMFSHAAHEQPRERRGFRVGRWQTRVSGIPEVRGELPVSAMAEEMLEPGDGQVRALIAVAGNPVLSTPSSDRLETALDGLDFMVSVDIYLNETSRHADVILPGSSPLRRPHYDFAFNQLSVRNVANYSPTLFPLPDGAPDEWQVLLRLGATVSGQGRDTDLDALDDGVFGMMVGSATGNPASPIHGRDPEEIFAATTGDGDDVLRGPERMLDFLVRTGPYGDGYGAAPDGLNLDRLREAPHGIDLGPLQPRLPEALCTPSGMIELAPDYLVADVPRLRDSAGREPNGGFLLVGRRHVRSNNSWMHNIDVLVKGKERCTLQMNPEDARRIGLEPDGNAKVSSSAGALVVPVELSYDIMPGVVSLPHGWGHDMEGSSLSVASGRPGVNTNRLSTGAMDPVSGNAILNGIAVEVVPA